MQKENYRGWLAERVKGAQTRSDQMSPVRRLEQAFGDLDAAFDLDRMDQVLNALAYSAADGRRGKALPAGITTRGDPAEAMATLRHAARLYRSFRTETAEAPLPAELRPLHCPLPTPTKRKLQPTGYWLFAASPGTWDADAWFATGARDLLYSVAPEDAPLMQVGDLGLIKRNVWRYVPAAIVAIVEVIEPASERPDEDQRYYCDPAFASEIEPRCRLAVLGHIATPLSARACPEEDAFRYVRHGIQRTSTAVPAEAFDHFASLAGITPADLIGARAARSSASIRKAETLAHGLTPQARERVSRYIERGSGRRSC